MSDDNNIKMFMIFYAFFWLSFKILVYVKCGVKFRDSSFVPTFNDLWFVIYQQNFIMFYRMF
jgi:hypothetical protein